MKTEDNDKKLTNPCNDCKVEFRHCPLYPSACERFDKYVKQRMDEKHENNRA